MHTNHHPQFRLANSRHAKSNLEKLEGNQDATSVFAKLEDRLSTFLKRQSEQQRR